MRLNENSKENRLKNWKKNMWKIDNLTIRISKYVVCWYTNRIKVQRPNMGLIHCNNKMVGRIIQPKMQNYRIQCWTRAKQSNDKTRWKKSNNKNDRRRCVQIIFPIFLHSTLNANQRQRIFNDSPMFLKSSFPTKWECAEKRWKHRYSHAQIHFTSHNK